MALDGLVIHSLAHELSTKLVGGKGFINLKMMKWFYMLEIIKKTSN